MTDSARDDPENGYVPFAFPEDLFNDRHFVELRNPPDIPDRLEPALEEHGVLVEANESLRQEVEASKKKIKSLEQRLSAALKRRELKLDVAQKETESIGQEHSAPQKENKECGQKGNKSPGEELPACQKELDLREFLKKFRETKEGKDLDIGLMKKACDEKSSDFRMDEHGQIWTNMDKYGRIGTNTDKWGRHSDRFKNPINTFSGIVIQLASERIILQSKEKEKAKEKAKETKPLNRGCQSGPAERDDSESRCEISTQGVELWGQQNRVRSYLEVLHETAAPKSRTLTPPNLSSDRLSEIESEIKIIESEIKIIDRKLASLKAVAKSFKKSAMKWDGSLCQGFYSLCLLVASVDKACHHDITQELLGDMQKRAVRGEYRYGGVELGQVVQAIIHQMRLHKPSLRKDCPAAGCQHSHQNEMKEEEEKKTEKEEEKKKKEEKKKVEEERKKMKTKAEEEKKKKKKSKKRT